MAVQFGVSFAGGMFEYFRVRRWPVLIGRSLRADLCLTQSPLVSRSHARISKGASSYSIELLGRNATYLRGEPLTPGQSREFDVGDLIELPDYRLELRNVAEAPSATIRMAAVPDSSVLVRRIAAALETSSWTIAAIFLWIRTSGSREVWVKHGKLTLCLNRQLTPKDLERQIDLFEVLIAEDIGNVTIDVIEPHRIRAAEPRLLHCLRANS